MAKLKWFSRGAVVLILPLALTHLDGLADAPYRWLTGYSRHELEELSYLSSEELETRIGLDRVPGGFDGDRAYRGRAAHAIASYLGTRRWGPDVTLTFGYLKEYVPALLQQGEAWNSL
jgi:hypothetical protein